MPKISSTEASYWKFMLKDIHSHYTRSGDHYGVQFAKQKDVGFDAHIFNMCKHQGPLIFIKENQCTCMRFTYVGDLLSLMTKDHDPTNDNGSNSFLFHRIQATSPCHNIKATYLHKKDLTANDQCPLSLQA